MNQKSAATWATEYHTEYSNNATNALKRALQIVCVVDFEIYRIGNFCIVLISPHLVGIISYIANRRGGVKWKDTVQLASTWCRSSYGSDAGILDPFWHFCIGMSCATETSHNRYFPWQSILPLTLSHGRIYLWYPISGNYQWSHHRPRHLDLRQEVSSRCARIIQSSWSKKWFCYNWLLIAFIPIRYARHAKKSFLSCLHQKLYYCIIRCKMDFIQNNYFSIVQWVPCLFYVS